MNNTYYFYEKINIERHRLIDLKNELREYFDDTDIDDSVLDDIGLIYNHLHKAILRLKDAEEIGRNRNI